MQELADRGSPLWMIFAPLAVDATAGSMIEVLRALRGRTDEDRFGELAVAMAVLADADDRARGLRVPIEAFLPGEITMRNFIYDRGLTAGIEQGIQQGMQQGRVEPARALLLETLLARRTAELFVDPA